MFPSASSLNTIASCSSLVKDGARGCPVVCVCVCVCMCMCVCKSVCVCMHVHACA